ncbi:MAG: hypothetical protein JJE04_14985 [Acidobacteriia bacterium]|nr:hypothetical protein [Terriglobia bacterium]
MRYFFRRKIPPFDRVLLIESGSRQIFEDLIPGLYDIYGEQMQLDLLTCFGGVPSAFRQDRGRVFRVTDHQGPAGRAQLYRLLDERRYSVAGIICSGEPVMTKWKCVLALRLPAKILILNENLDYFWLDWGHWKTIRHFILFRAGLAGAGAVRTLARLLLFPFTLLFLLLYAAVVHLRRKVHSMQPGATVTEPRP